ncbi:transcription antitermination factor NusB [Clostridium baratii]|uniref:Transcription antitermination protein NusB n=1 Tax=Clostridium baratii str. Sullivan TaxID=1415775 RepID=A0A0A7G0M8_9CLOT|nr:transcription antitermination factor NusB [Clostridium baratii]AIY84646.1 transcription antitermination factor NusB [Clostridium baratii str. Sullivan]MDU4910507.1 transcription antitermination factor NusB [Clostridium baratii]CUP04180.1 NusB antitermination factor [Clostridium baratii]
MSRKLSREKAMELIFSTMLTKESHEETIETFVDNYEGNINEVDLEYIKEVLKGVEENKEDIDTLIKNNLQKWKIERISKVNLAILRLAVYEMNYLNDVPEKVAINEALEITKRYSDEKSVSFINGVLDKIFKAK